MNHRRDPNGLPYAEAEQSYTGKVFSVSFVAFRALCVVPKEANLLGEDQLPDLLVNTPPPHLGDEPLKRPPLRSPFCTANIEVRLSTEPLLVHFGNRPLERLDLRRRHQSDSASAEAGAGEPGAEDA